MKCSSIEGCNFSSFIWNVATKLQKMQEFNVATIQLFIWNLEICNISTFQDCNKMQQNATLATNYATVKSSLNFLTRFVPGSEIKH